MKKLLTIACVAIAALSFNSCNTADENDAFKTAVAERITKSSEAPAAGNTITKPKYDTVYNVTAENIVEKLTEIKTGLDTGGGTQPAEFELKITGPFSKDDYMKIKTMDLLWNSTFNGTDNPVRIGLDFSSANLSDDMITFASLYYGAGNIKSIVFPKRVSDGLSLGGSTLSFLPFLEYVKLPDNLAYLPTSAFIQLHSETQDVSLQIEIPSGITSITANAFYYSQNLTKILLHEGIQSIEHDAFLMCTKLKSIELPSTLISLESCAFQRCSSLKEVKLNEGLTSIGSYAFNYCTSLESINIPSSVTKIESSAFERCSALKEVKLNEGLTTIGSKAFYTCTSLKSIDIPSTVETIKSAAFSESGLRSIKIPETVKTLEGSALYNCTNLESFEINTKIFPGYTVTRCSSLRSIVIGENVEEIKSWYAADIPNLKSVTFKNPNGWKINGNPVSSDDLKDPEKAANIFKANYYKAWTRN